MSEDSESWFYLIDQEGNRRVPCRVKARDGRQGYAVHPSGQGNDASAAEYTDDAKRMVQAVVLHGRGVRARTRGGRKDGQLNTVTLGGRAARGYWLAPQHHGWVAGAAVRPSGRCGSAHAEANSAPAGSVPTYPPQSVPTPTPIATPRVAGNLPSSTGEGFETQQPIRFADFCCQGGEKVLPAGGFALDDLTLAAEGSRRLRFAPLGNRPAAPLVALVGITPGGQINRFASYLATMPVEAAASRAAFVGGQSQIKELLSAHGFAARIGLPLDGDLNENPLILTTSVVKCCLMVDEGYRFAAPDIAASPAATRCATARLVAELGAYSTLRWVVIFGKPAWDALHELRLSGQPIIDVLRSRGLSVLQFPHFAQNFQQRALFVCDAAAEGKLLAEKPDHAKYAEGARVMRKALLEQVVGDRVEQCTS